MRVFGSAFAAGCLLLSSFLHPALAQGSDTAVSDDHLGVAPGVTGRSAAAGTGAYFVPGSSGTRQPARAATAPTLSTSVIGTDQRIKVDASDRYDYPFSTVVQITYSAGGKVRRCSGVLISADTVMTAGRCVAPGGGGKFYARNSFRIYPAVRGQNFDWTAGRCKGVLRASRLFSVLGWVAGGDEQYNYAGIKLNCPVGKDLGWIGFGGRDGSLTGMREAIAGYPSDKPGRYIWASGDRIRVSQPRLIFYGNDTSAGEIGAPVATDALTNCTVCAIGIHGRGRHGAGTHRAYNHGARITRAAFENLRFWTAQPPR